MVHNTCCSDWKFQLIKLPNKRQSISYQPRFDRSFPFSGWKKFEFKVKKIRPIRTDTLHIKDGEQKSDLSVALKNKFFITVKQMILLD